MVAKTCPGCLAAFDWPLRTQSVQCPSCGVTLNLDRQLPPPSMTGQRIMVIGLGVIVVGVLLALLSAL